MRKNSVTQNWPRNDTNENTNTLKVITVLQMLKRLEENLTRDMKGF